MKTILQKYAHLLVNYCISVVPNDKVFINSTTLAEPLVREIYRETLKAGGIPVVEFEFEGKDRILMEHGKDEQLRFVSPTYAAAMETYQGYINIRAPYNFSDIARPTPAQNAIFQEALSPYHKFYFERTATRALKRTLCQYPTHAAAQLAGMSLEEYAEFIFHACHLFSDDPQAAWLRVRAEQQKIVDLLNQKQTIRYKSSQTDIEFSTQGRVWINSDGQTNMPSGEVYTSPVEDSVNGVVHFDYPAVRMGEEVEGITLWVENGEVQRWAAKRGKAVLDSVFEISGARRFGEAAIGTNDRINRFTKNILFDEKIGGTIHMAIGQSYLQTGGKNQSAIHWDMISDMTQGGEIYADGELIYQNGRFLLDVFA